jgi:hypothetical protein
MAVRNFSPAEMVNPDPLPAWDVQYYLAERAVRASFMMVEIGHGGEPAAYCQPNLSGQRAYVGVEAWLRDAQGKKREHLRSLEAKRPDQNVAFIDHNVDPDTTPPLPADPARMRHSRPYKPRTILPDEAADEVLFSNVFGDPHVADSSKRTANLLREARRLVDEEGIIVIRETITPESAMLRLTDETLEDTGLQSVARHWYPSRRWQQLEKTYAGKGLDRFPKPMNFYQFLARISS